MGMRAGLTESGETRWTWSLKDVGTLAKRVKAGRARLLMEGQLETPSPPPPGVPGDLLYHPISASPGHVHN